MKYGPSIRKTVHSSSSLPPADNSLAPAGTPTKIYPASDIRIEQIPWERPQQRPRSLVPRPNGSGDIKDNTISWGQLTG
jgi:hypothetical protein